MEVNRAITRSGLAVQDLHPSHYGGWTGWINGACIKWCYDITYSDIEIWNPVEQRDLIKGELDIITLPVGFDFVPRFSTKSEMIEALQRRGLFHHCCFVCNKEFFTDHDLMVWSCIECSQAEKQIPAGTQLKLFEA